MKLQERTLWQNIKSGNFLPVYLIKGSEQYLKQKYAKLLADSVVPAGLEAFNYHALKGEETSAEEISEYVEALPAMCERSCVFVHDYDFDSTDDEEKGRLIKIFSDLPETCVLIFWQDTVGFSTRTKLAKEILALIDKGGAVCDLEKRTGRELVNFIVNECTKCEHEISFDTANYLLDCVGDDMANLINEVAKVCAYSKKTVTEKDIDAVAIKSLEANTFRMIDSILANDFDGAFWSLGLLFEQKVEPTMILGALSSAYVDMYRVKVFQNAGEAPKELREVFPGAYSKNPNKILNANRRCSKYSIASLRASLEFISKADFKIKSTYNSEKLIFEQLIIELAKARKLNAAH